jgi:DNA-binding NtrC family response regulator
MTGAQPTVLIVDDSEGVCLTLSMMLEKHGYHAQAVHNSKEALSVINDARFDLVIIDRNLGRESGLILAETLKLSDPAARLVMISGSETVRSEIEHHPAIRNLPVLLKPFTRQELLECLRTVLQAAA